MVAERRKAGSPSERAQAPREGVKRSEKAQRKAEACDRRSPTRREKGAGKHYGEAKVVFGLRAFVRHQAPYERFFFERREKEKSE